MASPQLNNRLGFINPGLALSHGFYSMNIFTFSDLSISAGSGVSARRDRSNNKKQQRNRDNNYFLRVIPPTDNVSI
jgi:hypothetical protein